MLRDDLHPQGKKREMMGQSDQQGEGRVTGESRRRQDQVRKHLNHLG